MLSLVYVNSFFGERNYQVCCADRLRLHLSKTYIHNGELLSSHLTPNQDRNQFRAKLAAKLHNLRLIEGQISKEYLSGFHLNAFWIRSKGLKNGDR